MDRIARIRQEIERRINILTNVYAEQVERKDEEMMTYYHGKVIALEELRPFLDTLSEEPNTPEFPETFEICLYDGRTPDNEKCTECSTTCSVRKEEPDKSLEEAAEEHYDEMWDELGGFAETRDGCYDIFFPSKAIRDTFIAGAEWQARQLLQGSPMPEDTVLFNKGVAEGRRLEREDMLKDAVEGIVCYGSKGAYIESDFLDAYDTEVYGNPGDKVRIVVLKEEE